MGNASSSSPGTLSIVLDPPPTPDGAYVAGLPLSGSVYVRSAAAMAPQALRADACVSGQERSRVRYTEARHYTDSRGDRKTRHVTRYRHAERRIVHVPIDLGRVSNGVRAGARYRFPFRVQLPADLPGSLRVCEDYGDHGGHGGGHGEITYTLEAELRGNSLFGKHRVDHPLRVVSAPLPPQPVPHLITPIVKDVRYFCCCRVGTITMGARVENTRVGRGERAVIDFACKNQSLRGIERAEVTVTEEVRFSAGGKHNRASRTVAQATFRETEHWERMSKRELRELRAGAGRGADALLGRQRGMLQVIHAAVHDGKHRALVQIDPTSLQSFQGLLMQVTHRLTIKVITAGCCTQNPSIEIPMHLGTPSSLLNQSAQLAVVGQPAAMPSAPPLPPMSMPAPSAPPAEWASAVATPVKVVGESAAVVGGASIWEADEGDAGEGTAHATLQNDSVLMAVAEVVPSLPNLLTEIEYAISPLSTVRRRLEEEEWRRRVFRVLTPTGYAAVIKAVAIEFDHPEMAALVAPEVGEYTHEYVVAALRAVSEWLRTPLLSKVLPLCRDLSDNAARIRAELTDWELVCTERDFEQATGGSYPRPFFLGDD